MKILAAVAVMLCSLLTGIEFFRRRQRACELLSLAADFCLYMHSCIKYEQSAPEEMMREYGSEDILLRKCVTYIESGNSFAEAWRRSTGENAGFLPREEFGLIMQLGSELGRTDISGELMRLEHIYSRLDGLFVKRSGQLENDRRLCLSVSLLSGLFITIMLS